MTDGSTRGAPARLVEAIVNAGDVNLTAMVLITGAPDLVVAVVEATVSSKRAAEWCVALWKVIQQGSAPEHLLQIIAERCSPRAIAVLLVALTSVGRIDPQFCDQMLAQVRQHMTEKRRIVVADELAQSNAEVAAQLLGTGDAAPLDAATQAGLAATRGALMINQVPTGTASGTNGFRLGRAVITFEAAGVRCRQEWMPWSRGQSISWRELAGRTVAWDGTGLVLQGTFAGTRPYRWVAGRVDRDTGKFAAITLTRIASYIEEVLKVRRDAPVLAPPARE
jgi:hypothetical protein